MKRFLINPDMKIADGIVCLQRMFGALNRFDSEVRRANNKKPNDRNFGSCPQRTKHLNSRCDLLTEIDMIISVRDCLQMDVNENQRLLLSGDVCDNHADRSSEKHNEVPKHLHSLLTCHSSSAHYVHS